MNAATNASNLDTLLFLFKSDGTPVATNDDDASGLVFTSTLPAGNALYANLSAGSYLLAIAVAGNQAVNTSNQVVFQAPTNGTTPTYGPATGLNPSVASGFDSFTYEEEAGAYQINLTSTNASIVPEPGSLLAAFVAVGAVGARRRRV